MMHWAVASWMTLTCTLVQISHNTPAKYLKAFVPEVVL